MNNILRMLYLPNCLQCLLQVKIILPSCTIREIVCTFTFGFQVFNYGVWQGLKGLLCSPLSLYTVVEAIIGENKYPAINYSSTLEPFSMNWSLLCRSQQQQQQQLYYNGHLFTTYDSVQQRSQLSLVGVDSTIK